MGSWRVPPGVYSVLGQHVPRPDPYAAAVSLDIAATEGLVPVGDGFRGGGGAGAPAEAAPVNAADDVADADDGAPAAAAAAAGADADEEEEDPLLELTRKSPLPDTPSDGEGDEGPLCAPPAAGSLSDSMLPDSGENWHQFYRRRCEELCLSVWTTKRSRFNHPARYGDTGSSSRQKCLGNVDWIAMLWSSKRLSVAAWSRSVTASCTGHTTLSAINGSSACYATSPGSAAAPPISRARAQSSETAG